MQRRAARYSRKRRSEHLHDEVKMSVGSRVLEAFGKEQCNWKAGQYNKQCVIDGTRCLPNTVGHAGSTCAGEAGQQSC